MGDAIARRVVDGFLALKQGVRGGSMYCLIPLIGVAPQDAAKEDGDHRAPFQERLTSAGWFCRGLRLDTPVRLYISFEIAILGGSFTTGCARSSPSASSTGSAPNSAQTGVKMERASSRTALVNTRRLYLVTKTR